MAKKVQEPTRTLPDKKVKASPTPALLTALALLSVSLRVTDGNPADDVSATPNTAPEARDVKMAAAHKTNATNNSGVANKATATSVKFKFTTTTKDKVDTFLAKPSHGSSGSTSTLRGGNSNNQKGGRY